MGLEISVWFCDTCMQVNVRMDGLGTSALRGLCEEQKDDKDVLELHAVEGLIVG